MAWTKWRTSDGLVLGVYATQAAAAPDTGESREEVDPLPDTLAPGQFRHSDGSYSDQPPDSATADSVKSAQRQEIYDAYQWWRIHGRTEHWVSLSAETDPRTAIRSTDKWAYHIVALCDRVIEGEVWNTLDAAARQAFVDHATNILRTLGPTWYSVQVSNLASGDSSLSGRVTNYANANTSAADGSTIYTDICTNAGVTRSVDGQWLSMPTTIASGFDAEDANLGRS